VTPLHSDHAVESPDGSPRPIRCAIYTRKSTEEGLGQEFNSLMAQREAAEAYIASQREQRWTLVGSRYDDGGFGGGNMERPALKQLLNDIEAGQIDCVVVYKVDRLSRSLLDFSRIICRSPQRARNPLRVCPRRSPACSRPAGDSVCPCRARGKCF
jgi:Resolvase, N terminal domain